MERLNCLFLLMSVLLLTQCASSEAVIAPVEVVQTLPPPQVVEAVLATNVPSVEQVEAATAVTPSSTVIQLPTATPAPLPTPIVYQVQEGDTLLGIALQHNRTVAEIEALNPNLNPDLLSIGQEIQMPPLSATPLATGLAQVGGETAVLIHLSILQIVAYQTPVGSVWLLGELLNEGDLPVESVQVAIDLLDDGLNKLDTVLVWTAVSIIQPGGKVPFGVLISEPPVAFDQPAAIIVGGNLVAGLGSRYLDVDVLETAVERQDGQLQISGQLQNVGSQPATEIRLVATFYDDEQTINGFQQQVMDDELGVGETAVFSFIAAPPGEQTVSASVIAEAIIFAEE